MRRQAQQVSVEAESPRYLSYPTRLEAEDFEAILAQAVDPEASYRVEGWILRAMADELLRLRASVRPEKRHQRDVLPGQTSFLEES